MHCRGMLPFHPCRTPGLWGEGWVKAKGGKHSAHAFSHSDLQSMYSKGHWIERAHEGRRAGCILSRKEVEACRPSFRICRGLCSQNRERGEKEQEVCREAGGGETTTTRWRFKDPCDPGDDPEHIRWGTAEESSRQAECLRAEEPGTLVFHRRSDHLICSLADCST